MKPVTPTEAQKKQGNAVMAVGWLILLALLVVFGVTSYAAQRVSFWKVPGHLWIISMTRLQTRWVCKSGVGRTAPAES